MNLLREVKRLVLAANPAAAQAVELESARAVLDAVAAEPDAFNQRGGTTVHLLAVYAAKREFESVEAQASSREGLESALLAARGRYEIALRNALYRILRIDRDEVLAIREYMRRYGATQTQMWNSIPDQVIEFYGAEKFI